VFFDSGIVESYCVLYTTWPHANDNPPARVYKRCSGFWPNHLESLTSTNLEEERTSLINDMAVLPSSCSLNINPRTSKPEESALRGGYKSSFVSEGLRVGCFVCDIEGRHPEVEKVRKIIDWPPCRSFTEGKAFIGNCVYHRL
jgi:hypothetical protein